MAFEARVENTANFGDQSSGLQVGQVSGHTVNVHQHQNTTPSQDETDKFVQSLSSRYRQQKNLNEDRTPETCEWFLRDERFLTWRNAADARLLHVTAGPGCGKSVLAKALIDERLVGNEKTSAIVYFFFKSGQSSQERSHSAIAAMLHQLYSLHPEPTLKLPAMQRYKLHGHHLATMIDELWDVLLETCALLDGIVVGVLDALDECEQRDQRTLIKDVIRMFSRIKGSLKLKLLITSRPYQEISFAHATLDAAPLSILLDGDEEASAKARDIELVIEDKVSQVMYRLPRVTQVATIKHLQAKENRNRTYLWLSLILDYVEKNISGNGTEENIQELISKLPETVDDAYDALLKRSTNQSLTKTLLSVTLAAKRPLTVAELNIGAALSRGPHDSIAALIQSLEPDEIFRDSLRDLCGLLLTINDNRVHFLHETVREFLLSGPTNKTSSCHTWKGCITPKKSEACIAAACIRYLSMSEFQEPRSYVRRVTHEISSLVERWVELHAFLKYASEYWSTHFRDSDMAVENEWLSAALKLLENMSSVYCVWMMANTTLQRTHIHWLRDLRNQHLALDYIASNGLDTCLHSFLEKHQFNELKGSLSIATKNAVRYQHWRCFWIITAYATSQGFKFDIMLAFAILEEANDFHFQKIFESNLDFQLKSVDLVRLLRKASINRAATAVCILIDRFLRFESPSDDMWRLWISAVASPIQEEFARILLERYPAYANKTWEVLLNSAGVYMMQYEPILEAERSLFSTEPDRTRVTWDSSGPYIDRFTFHGAIQGAIQSQNMELENDLRDLCANNYPPKNEESLSKVETQNLRVLGSLLRDYRSYNLQIDLLLRQVASVGCEKGVRLFLSHTSGISMGIADNYSFALVAAAANGYARIAELLLQHFSIIPRATLSAALSNSISHRHRDVEISLKARVNKGTVKDAGSDTDESWDNTFAEMDIEES